MGTIIGFILLIIVSIILFLCFVLYKNKFKKDEDRDDRNISLIFLSTSILSMILCFLLTIVSAYNEVDEGEGALLLQFGEIYDSVNVPGPFWARPWASIIKWQIREKSIDQKIEARTMDDMSVTIDVTLWWKVKVSQMDKLYSRVAKDYESLEKGFVIPGIRSAIRDEVSKVTYRELNTNRMKYANIITDYTMEQLSKKFVFIDRVNIRNVIPPSAVNDAIEAKLKMKQKAEEAKHKLDLAKKNAEIKKAEAKGIRDAQEIIQQRLTPLYVQWYAIEMQRELAGSNNTTFYFVPMSKSSGVPMVYNAPIK